MLGRWWGMVLLLGWCSGIVTAEEPSQRVEIPRDAWGIPHVFAESDAGAFYGLGYATAEAGGRHAR